MQDDTRDLFKEGYDYAVKTAAALPCVFENGYTCAANQNASLPGIYLPYLQVAYADFMSIAELSAEAKKLVHYVLSVKVEKDQVIVEFGGLLMPKNVVDGQPDGVVLASVGKSTTYWINQQSLQIERRLFER